MNGGKIHIKVCGMRDESNINELIKISPDYIGFNFFKGSLRYVGKDFDPSFTDGIPGNIKKVGVFVSEDIDSVCENGSIYNLDLVQLHGGENADYCRQLYYRGITLIKVFSIKKGFDFTCLSDFEPYCRYFLFDTVCRTYGGSGKKFNWDILKGYNNNKPVFLSGGIDLADAEQIKNIKDLDIHAVDINSRFENKPGIKDINKIKEFIQILKY